VTRELARWPARSSLDRADFDWRVSTADVREDGPFSGFPGLERLLVVTHGEGLLLRHGGDAPRARLRRMEPYRFDGGWSTEARLVGGPVADFNLMFRPGRVRAEVQALRLGERRTREELPAGHAFVHVPSGGVGLRLTGEEERFELGAGDSLWVRGLRGGEELDASGATPDAELILVRLSAAAG